MKSTVLVSLVSEQTVPNYLSFKTFCEANAYFFISTQRMEDPVKGNRREWLIKAADIREDQTTMILVNPEIREDVLEKLSRIPWQEQFSRIIVNITGGTKMMSLATWEFFHPITSEIWYLPINSNDYHLVSDSSVKRTVTYHMSVDEYLACCGISREANQFREKPPLFDQETNDALFSQLIDFEQCHRPAELIRLLFRDDDAPLKNQIDKRIGAGKLIKMAQATGSQLPVLPERKSGIDLKDEKILAAFQAKMDSHDEAIPESKRAKLKEIGSFDFIFGFFDKIGLPYEVKDLLLKDQVNYVTGGWFEEYTYYLLKRISGQPDSHFKLGVVLDSNRDSYFTSNDLDVVMVYNNNLYVIECKSGGMEENELFNKTVYLQAALRKYFGLSVRSVLMTLSSTSDSQKKKAETLGISLIDRAVILDPQAGDLIGNILRVKK